MVARIDADTHTIDYLETSFPPLRAFASLADLQAQHDALGGRDRVSAEQGALGYAYLSCLDTLDGWSLP
jgi:hypothetical protein